MKFYIRILSTLSNLQINRNVYNSSNSRHLSNSPWKNIINKMANSKIEDSVNDHKIKKQNITDSNIIPSTVNQAGICNSSTTQFCSDTSKLNTNVIDPIKRKQVNTVPPSKSSINPISNVDAHIPPLIITPSNVVNNNIIQEHNIDDVVEHNASGFNKVTTVSPNTFASIKKSLFPQPAVANAVASSVSTIATSNDTQKSWMSNKKIKTIPNNSSPMNDPTIIVPPPSVLSTVTTIAPPLSVSSNETTIAPQPSLLSNEATIAPQPLVLSNDATIAPPPSLTQPTFSSMFKSVSPRPNHASRPAVANNNTDKIRNALNNTSTDSKTTSPHISSFTTNTTTSDSNTSATSQPVASTTSTNASITGNFSSLYQVASKRTAQRTSSTTTSPASPPTAPSPTIFNDLGGKSIRESILKREEEDRRRKSAPSPATSGSSIFNTTFSTTRPFLRIPGDEALSSVASTLHSEEARPAAAMSSSPGVGVGAAGEIDAAVEDVTPNEILHERKLVHLDFKKRKFYNKHPEEPVARWSKAEPGSDGKYAAANISKTAQPYKRYTPWKAEQLQKSIREKAKNTNSDQSSTSTKETHGTVVKAVTLPAEGLTVKDLASKLSLKLVDIKKRLSELGEDIEDENKMVEADTAELLILELGLQVTRQKSKDTDLSPSHTAGGNVVLVPRAPLVCIMGHVDHGKTTLLDSLRTAKVAATEAGGITQKLSAFSIQTNGREVVFLDTPGHAAFSTMRNNGAIATDIVVLVVAIDDGVRPQTIEALQVALNAGCSVIIAINKIDKLTSSDSRTDARRRVLSQLVEFGLVAEDFGGEAQVVEVSGKSKEGLDQLLEKLLLQADILELRASESGQAEGVVLDANMEKGRGVVADVLVKWGQLRIGDPIVIGTIHGKVKAMVNDKGQNISVAGPSTPVRILGLRTVPSAGQEMLSVANEAKARQIVERRERVIELRKSLEDTTTSTKTTVTPAKTDDPANGDNDSKAVSKEVEVTIPALNVILKSDGVGTLEALRKIVDTLSSKTQDITVRVIGQSVGDINRTDIDLANTSLQGAIILGFNVGLVDATTRTAAKELDVKVFRDTVIYRLEDQLKATMVTLMPKYKAYDPQGGATVLKTFLLNDKKSLTVAGISIHTGHFKIGPQYVYRVLRAGQVIGDELVAVNLKRFRDTVHEVSQGHECGLTLDGYTDYCEGDEIQCLHVELKSKELTFKEESFSSGSSDFHYTASVA